MKYAPYAINLLNGIKLFGRPIKIQLRSGSSHTSQDVGLSYPQHHAGNSSPTSTLGVDMRGLWVICLLQKINRQAVMNNVLRQMSYGEKFGSPHVDQSGFSPSTQSHNHTFNQSSSSQWHQDTPSSLRKPRQNSHPYLADRHRSREQHSPDHGSDYHYRRGRDDFFYEDRNDGWSHDYGNRSRDGKWHSSQH